MSLKLLLLGAPQVGGDCWHTDIADEAKELGWSCDYIRVKDRPVDEIAKRAKGCDMMLWARTHSHNPRGDAAEMLRRVEDAGTVTVGLHLDLYWGLKLREKRIGVEPWWSSQYVFTADGGDRNWTGKGVNHFWCPPALGARHLERVKPDGRYRYVFFGSDIRSIHGDHRAKMLAWAKAKWGRQFAHYGASLRSRVYGRKLSGMCTYANAVLGDAAPAPYYWSDRVVRMLGRGSVFCHPVTDGMKEQGFTDDVMIPFKRYDFSTLGERIAEVTADRRQSSEMRDAATEVVRSRHLWRHRLAMFAETAGLA
jgi:hypothetical protein